MISSPPISKSRTVLLRLLFFMDICPQRITNAFTVMQYIAWTILFLITVWQLFRSFGGPISEAENPLSLLLRSALFAVLIYELFGPLFTRMALTAAGDIKPMSEEVKMRRHHKLQEVLRILQL